jgi:uracil-DNA glycosylase
MQPSDRTHHILQELGISAYKLRTAAPETPIVTTEYIAIQPIYTLSTSNITIQKNISELGWDELQTRVAGCTACGLSTSRTQTVFGVGQREADWVIVGEAPGQHEDEQGEPFVGASGKLLDAMLHAVGLSRQAATDANDAANPASRGVYICNTLKCRPPGNRDPAAAELAACEPFLQRQLALLKPKVILAMGRFAVAQLLQSKEPIGRLRGRTHSYAGVPLVVTYHPAYLLRNLPEKRAAWEDLCLAQAVVQAAATPK